MISYLVVLAVGPAPLDAIALAAVSPPLPVTRHSSLATGRVIGPAIELLQLVGI
jgi:hypothetical protein